MSEVDPFDDLYPENFDFNEFYESAVALDTPPWVQAFLGGIFMLLITVGNIWVIVAVFRQPKLRNSATNLFIVSLSVSDLIIALVFIPVHIASFGYRLPISNRGACKFLFYIHWAAMCGTTFSLICIGLDRFRAIVQPLRPKMTVTHAAIGCTIVWVCSLGYSSVKIFTNDVITRNFTSIQVYGNETVFGYVVSSECHIVDFKLDMIFRYVDLVVMYLIPLVILFVLYACMIITLWFGKAPTNSSNRSKKKAVKMLSFVVIQFAVTWLPNYSLQLYFVVTTRVPLIPFIWSNTPATMTTFFLLCNSWINPILYAYFNENYRKEFKKLFPCFHKCKEGKVSPEDTARATAVSNKSGTTGTTKSTAATNVSSTVQA
ncbi:G-protein coupled receptor 83-like [Ptychodera flava]|uniref:G-protein coupled receptor 83-like n=1 Tax=Ptychodera flava TaxID=63121 RepID=UPI00396A784A